MKNNTAYLKNIHWVFLLAVAYGLTSIYLSPWVYELFGNANRIYPSLVLSVFLTGITYTGIA